MLPHGNKEDFTHCDMEILISEDVIEVVVEVEEEEEVGSVKMFQKEVQVEDEEDSIPVEMEEMNNIEMVFYPHLEKT